MPVTAKDIIPPVLSEDEVKQCIATAEKLLENMNDRADLHSRSTLERFNDIVMGEIAERSVIKWLQQQGKYARSAVDKNSGQPDNGRDIILHSADGKEIGCSVKSSLSAMKTEMDDILNTFRLSSKRAEIQAVNIQVYFWLDLKGKTRVTTPSNHNMAIMGWCGSKDLLDRQEGHYATEDRPVIDVTLKELRTMESLLEFIQ